MTALLSLLLCIIFVFIDSISVFLGTGFTNISVTFHSRHSYLKLLSNIPDNMIIGIEGLRVFNSHCRNLVTNSVPYIFGMI